MVSDARVIGERLTHAARLPGRVVCVVGSDEPLKGTVQLGKVDRCIARVVYMLAMKKEMAPVYFGTTAKQGLCPGGQGWCGLSPSSPMVKYFISTGTPEFRNGEAEYLKPNPDAAERFFLAPGKIIPPSKYLNIMGYDQLDADQKVLSFILIGSAESIRNMGGLIQFVSEDIFNMAIMPGGPTCASMITYAAGMSERAPKNAAVVGPVDPTGNDWFPPDMMSMAIPFDLAKKMADGADASFLGKRPQVAFPAKRLGIDEKHSEIE
jgi:hypothetical protein